MGRLILALSLLLAGVLTVSAGVDAFRPRAASHARTRSAASTADALAASFPRGGAAAAAASSTPPDPPKRALSPADLALAGGLSTMIGDILLHPVDCIKTLQQSNEGAGLSLLGASRKIMADSGPPGFYSGLGTYVTADGGAGALKFATYEGLKKWVAKKVPDERYAGAALFGCAAAAYVASSVVLIPGELIKQRLQMGMVHSVGGAIRSIWKTEGIGGFFAGSSGVWIRDVPYTMLELGIYDNVKALCTRLRNANNGGDGDGSNSSQVDEIVSAALAGGITGYLTNPMDLVKTKMMLSPDVYRGFADAWRKTVQEGGLASLFNGAGARVGYIMPFCTFYLPVYEIIKRKLESCGPIGGSAKNKISVRGGAMGGAPRRRKRSAHPLRDNRCFVSF
jgi:solute carrier family 25 S-adenosylmethionine transporter 26